MTEDNRNPVTEETGERFSGLYCLALMCQFHKTPVDLEAIRHEYCLDGTDLTPLSMLRIARKLGMKAKETRLRFSRLETTPCPFIACMEDGSYRIIGAIREGKVLSQCPGDQPETEPLGAFYERWQGHAILMTPRSHLKSAMGRFDINWFVPVLVKYRRLLRDVLAASFFIQIFALVTPLIFQVVMDKVLVHQAEKTLTVLLIALLAISLFDVVLNTLRSYIFTHTTNRIDVELGTQLFQHMMQLPLNFFKLRPVGQIVARVRELETVRQFLTGNGLTLILDLFFSVIIIAVLFFYSERLAWIVVGSIPFYIAISILITPELRRRTEEQFQQSALKQSFLTESVTGIETLKAMAVEPQMRQRWETYLASYARSSFRTAALGIYGSQSVQLVSKIVTALLMWQGALQVIDGQLTVGELIAFNMLSGQVAAPILRLAQLWQDFQQFRISMEKLGDLLNVPVESPMDPSRPALPAMQGAIRFEQVVFRYQPGAPEVIRQLDLDIPAGQLVGIAGRSGSGKSTLTRLLQRMYLPESGKIFIDGNNLVLADPSWIRRQMGIVLQDNILFNGSVRENIALANPSASMESVIGAAELAGAHDFIAGLPRGYSTELGERGSGLSGGQLQRIAIARALINDPKILVFDEATSALDYESEKVIQDNLSRISQGRTVIIIAHRLSTLRQCQRILVMDKGAIIEEGSHDSLMSGDSLYKALWLSQTGDASGDGHV